MKTLNSNQRLLNQAMEFLRNSLNEFVEEKSNNSENSTGVLKEEVRKTLFNTESEFNQYLTTDRITKSISTNLKAKTIELYSGQILKLENIPKYKSLGSALSEAFESEEIQLICAYCKEKNTYECSQFNNIVEDFGEVCCQKCKTPWLEFSYEK